MIDLREYFRKHFVENIHGYYQRYKIEIEKEINQFLEQVNTRLFLMMLK